MQKINKIIVKKSVIEDYIRKYLDKEMELNELLDSDDWTISHGNKPVATPAVISEPPLDKDMVNISPATQNQVSDPDLPINDDEWCPGSKKELIKASSQLIEDVSDGNLSWFWGRLKNLVEKSNEDYGAPGTGDMEKDEKAEPLPQDKHRQRTNERETSL